MFTEDMKTFMREAVEGFADNYGIEIERLEADGDHVHILFKPKPSTDLTKFIETLKGSTARRIRNAFHDEIKPELWGDSFWTDSYCLISRGKCRLMFSSNTSIASAMIPRTTDESETILLPKRRMRRCDPREAVDRPRDRMGEVGLWGGMVELMHWDRCGWDGGITETNTPPGHERLCPDWDGTLILGI